MLQIKGFFLRPKNVDSALIHLLKSGEEIGTMKKVASDVILITLALIATKVIIKYDQTNRDLLILQLNYFDLQG